MIHDNEIEIRTESENMLVCTAVHNDFGGFELITRKNKKEDRISLESFLCQLHKLPKSNSNHC